jgi:hypothetical protein
MIRNLVARLFPLPHDWHPRYRGHHIPRKLVTIEGKYLGEWPQPTPTPDHAGADDDYADLLHDLVEERKAVEEGRVVDLGLTGEATADEHLVRVLQEGTAEVPVITAYDRHDRAARLETQAEFDAAFAGIAEEHDAEFAETLYAFVRDDEVFANLMRHALSWRNSELDTREFAAVKP